MKSFKPKCPFCKKKTLHTSGKIVWCNQCMYREELRVEGLF